MLCAFLFFINHPMMKIKEIIYKFGDKGNMFQPPYGES